MLFARYARGLELLDEYLEKCRKAGPDDKDRLKPALHSPSSITYICAGCSMADDGLLRQQVVEFASCPVLRAWVAHRMKEAGREPCLLGNLAVHEKVYEEGADPVGYGGVVGVQPINLNRPWDLTAQTSVVMQLWKTTPGTYLWAGEFKTLRHGLAKCSSEEWENRLLLLGMTLHPFGWTYLSNLTGLLGSKESSDVPHNVVPEQHYAAMTALLGMPALQQVLFGDDAGQRWHALYGGRALVRGDHLTLPVALELARQAWS